MNVPIKIFFTAVLAFVLASCSSNQATSTATAQPMNAGKQAPVFDLVDLEGNQHDLTEYAGKKVYVKFWASWCSICLAGMEELNTLAGEDTDFEVLTIVSPSSNAEKDSESFAKWFGGVENASNITVLLDEGGAVFEEYGVLAYPTSVYIGSDGVLVKSSPGHFSNAQIYESFESIQ
ncbi:TlpA family protein disulfide reductase [Planococcus shenhongbingii]|uniref:Redoxin family protein n=1 Tax=Planococcus shenhongbingii TaxID=3058398 RepID=A0ABT8NEY0_9BACL|nr:redoxin family protein [Planococcus sp. N017]MDN7246422.1 redoxin family protein [Planococcus sp. N017]